MEIKTKFNLDHPCWIMTDNIPVQMYIDGIFVQLTEVDGKIVTDIEYTIKGKYGGPEIRCKEERLFPTKNELLKTL